MFSIKCLRPPPCLLQCNPSELELCEDLSELQYVNESGVLHTLTSRAQASLPLTQAGPNLISLWPPSHPHSKVLRPNTRQEGGSYCETILASNRCPSMAALFQNLRPIRVMLVISL